MSEAVAPAVDVAGVEEAGTVAFVLLHKCPAVCPLQRSRQHACTCRAPDCVAFTLMSLSLGSLKASLLLVREYLSKCYNKQLPRARKCVCVRQCRCVRVHDASECACVCVLVTLLLTSLQTLSSTTAPPGCPSCLSSSSASASCRAAARCIRVRMEAGGKVRDRGIWRGDCACAVA